MPTIHSINVSSQTGTTNSTTTITGLASTANLSVGQSITGDKIQDGAITRPQIGAGAVATNKLNTALHMIF